MNKTVSTIKAIPYSTRDEYSDYLVMVAHAGRRDRTGGRVHLATLTVWKSGNVTIGATTCSNNGSLRGSLITGDHAQDFGRVSCQKCGAAPEHAAARNAKAIDLAIGGAK